MAFDPAKHHRRSTRLPTFDYAGNAAYVVTLCALDRIPIFGEIADGTVRLTEAGNLVTCGWLGSPTIRPNLSLDAFVLMPNHLHGVVIFSPDRVGAEAGRTAVRPYEADASPATGHGLARKPQLLGSFIAQFKATTTRAINILDGVETRRQIWQRGFHEHVVRNDADLDRIRAYVDANPARWSDDPENPRSP